MSIRPRKLKDGSLVYDITIDLARKPNGDRNQERHTCGTMKEARAWETMRKAEVLAGKAVARPKLTFGAYIDQWFEDVSSLKHEESTRRQYRFVADKRVLPALGKIGLADLTTPHLQRWIAGLARTPSRRGGTLSRRSVDESRAFVHMVLETATRQRMLAHNPADALEMPRIERAPRKQAWTDEEAARFLTVAQQDPYEPIWTLALLTGMRRGELLGLRWQDIDWDAGVARVLQTRTKAGSDPTTKGPKNRTSRRRIPLSPDALSVLTAHRARQHLHIEESANAYHDQDLICCNWFGDFWYPDTVTHRFKQLVALAGVRAVNLHYTRHTFASLALARGASLAAVSEVLGHSNKRTTIRMYQSVEPEQHSAVVDTVARAVMSHLGPDVTSIVTNKEEAEEKAAPVEAASPEELVHPWRLERQTFRSAI